jgi:hypothetical protein
MMRRIVPHAVQPLLKPQSTSRRYFKKTNLQLKPGIADKTTISLDRSFNELMVIQVDGIPPHGLQHRT